MWHRFDTRNVTFVVTGEGRIARMAREARMARMVVSKDSENS